MITTSNPGLCGGPPVPKRVLSPQISQGAGSIFSEASYEQSFTPDCSDEVRRRIDSLTPGRSVELPEEVQPRAVGSPDNESVVFDSGASISERDGVITVTGVDGQTQTLPGEMRFEKDGFEISYGPINDWTQHVRTDGYTTVQGPIDETYGFRLSFDAEGRLYGNLGRVKNAHVDGNSIVMEGEGFHRAFHPPVPMSWLVHGEP